MIEVRYANHDTQFRTQLQQDPQQRDRVSSPRDTHGHPVAGTHQLFFANIAKHFRAHPEQFKSIQWTGDGLRCQADRLTREISIAAE